MRTHHHYRARIATLRMSAPLPEDEDDTRFAIGASLDGARHYPGHTLSEWRRLFAQIRASL